jgi:threonine synthase
MTKPSYISTRGKAPELGFDDVLLAGLADDGGLYVPKTLPVIDANRIRAFAGMSYIEITKDVIGRFVDLDADKLSDLIDASYKKFHHSDIAPLVQLEGQQWVMEQFHGPTLAFKDFALQFLGHIFDSVLEAQNRHITIVGATSGDTGSAAIEGCRGRDNMDIFILHPYNRVSEVQRRQMTTVTDKNVHNIAVEGSFDDCQDLVKAMFGDADFRKDINMSAVNSINWARIMAQIVYYFYASAKLAADYGTVSFSVPTGNFGNIYAGYLAKKMGAPIDHLIVATNRNDILYRFMKTGEMKIEGVTPSLSPSMDIQISSNFERLLFDLYDGDAGKVRAAMADFRKDRSFKVTDEGFDKLKPVFDAYRCDDTQTEATINTVFKDHDYLLDPHSAAGVYAMQHFLQEHPDYGGAVVSLATAHPAKFPDAVEKAVGFRPELPDWLSDLYQATERYDRLPNDLNVIKEHIRNLT